jgi:hypothetical protein
MENTSHPSIQWFCHYVADQQIPRAELSEALGYDESTLSKILNGKYQGNTEHIVKAIDAYRASVLPAVDLGEDFPFVMTKLTTSIWGYIDMVRLYRKIGLIIGDSQAGKTRSIEEYIRQHPELDLLHLRLTVGGHRSKVVAEMCDLRGISLKYNTTERELRLTRATESVGARPITRRTMLLVDEIQQCAARAKAGGRMSGERIDTLEFFRWLKDLTKCSMVFFGTTEALGMMTGKGAGHDSGHILLQTLRRSLPTYTLKSKPVRADLNAFAAKLGLPPAAEAALRLQEDVIDKDGLGNWLTLLQAGNGRAAALGRAMAWDDVLEADALFQRAGGRAS